MKIQVLIAAMHQTDDSLIQKMNISTDAIIGNQCEICSNEVYQYDGFQVVYYNRPDRGVGMNRNEALLHSTGDILLFSDADVVFENHYGEIILKAFQEIPDADGIIFNIRTVGAEVDRRQNHKVKRLKFFNALNYNTPRLAVKASSIRKHNITFHSCFGGGTIYNAGEDSLFIADMLRKGLKLYAYPVCIGDEYQYESTWFTGYNPKCIHDKGAFFSALSKPFAKLLCLQDLLRHPYIYRKAGYSFGEAYGIMKQGIKDYATLTSYKEVDET